MAENLCSGKESSNTFLGILTGYACFRCFVSNDACWNDLKRRPFLHILDSHQGSLSFCRCYECYVLRISFLCARWSFWYLRSLSVLTEISLFVKLKKQNKKKKPLLMCPFRCAWLTCWNAISDKVSSSLSDEYMFLSICIYIFIPMNFSDVPKTESAR